MSSEFRITTGVLQGDVLAPFLFIIAVDYIMVKSENDFGFRLSTTKSSRVFSNIADLDYADDIALLESNTSRATAQVNELASNAREVGLEINIKKTEFMALNVPADTAPVSVHAQPLDRVDNFKYLGSMMKSSLDDLNYRTGQAWTAFWKLRPLWQTPEHHVSLHMKLHFFEASVLTIFLYGSETWLLSSQMESKIDSFGAACLRFILHQRRAASYHDHSEIYKRAGMPTLSKRVNERRLRWVGHLLRLEKGEPARELAIFEPPHALGKFKRGAEPHSYKRQIAGQLTSAPEDMTASAMAASAADKINWKKLVAACLK